MKVVFICILLTVIITAAIGANIDETGCLTDFQGKCHCYHNEESKFVVNCTNTKFKYSSIISSVPDNTNILLMNGNYFERLDLNLFGKFKSLEVINFSNNRIRRISGKAFKRIKSVKELILDHNDIERGFNIGAFVNLEALHLTNAFDEFIDENWIIEHLSEISVSKKMKKFKKIHLEQNEICGFGDPDLFCKIPSLEQIYLGDNQLKDFSINLECLKKLKYVDLQYNKIKNLNDTAIQGLEKSGYAAVNLKGNPFKCDCDMKSFYDWVTKSKPFNTKLYHKEDLRCYDGFPATNAGVLIVKLQQLSCPKQD